MKHFVEIETDSFCDRTQSSQEILKNSYKILHRKKMKILVMNQILIMEESKLDTVYCIL